MIFIISKLWSWKISESIDIMISKPQSAFLKLKYLPRFVTKCDDSFIPVQYCWLVVLLPNSQEYNFKATNEECIDLTIYFIKESKTNHDGQRHVGYIIGSLCQKTSILSSLFKTEVGLYGVIACVHSFTTKPTEGRGIHVVSAIPTDRYSPP